MKNYLFLVLIASIYLISNLVYGDESKTEKIKLEDVISRALENNLEFKAVKSESEMKFHQIGPKSSYDDPELSFEMQNYPKDTLSASEYSMTGNQIALSQKVPFPGKLSQLGQIAQKNFEVSRQNVKLKELEIVRDAKVTYFALHLAFKKRAVLQEEKNLLKQVVKSTRQRFSAGKTTQGELLMTELEESNLLLEILKAEQEIDEKTGDLNHLLSAPHHARLEPEEVVKTPVNFSLWTESALSEKALKQNPEIAIKNSETHASAAQLSFAEKNYIPDFIFGAGYTLRRPSPGDRGVDFVSAKIGITLPIWVGSKQSEEVKVAKADHFRTKYLWEEEKSHLLHAIHTLYASITESSKRLELFDGGLLPLAQQTVSSSLTAYQTNRLPYSALLNSIKIRYENEYSRNQALVELESSIAKLEFLVGEKIGAMSP